VGLVIQGGCAARLNGLRIGDDRNTGLERLLTQVPVLRVQGFPVIYVGTPWLDFANYRLAARASLLADLAGMAVFAVGLAVGRGRYSACARRN